MSFFVFILCFAFKAHSFEVPKDFEASKNFSGEISLWIQPKTFETVSLVDEDVSSYQESKNPFADLKQVMEAKAKTLPQILSIKDWKVSSSKEIEGKNGSKLILFFGSYIDSSDELTQFAEVYNFRQQEKPKAYLFTRSSVEGPWTEKELSERFKVTP